MYMLLQRWQEKGLSTGFYSILKLTTTRLVDSIFTRETLQCSTVHGTKEYAPLDQQIIAAIKGGSNVM